MRWGWPPALLLLVLVPLLLAGHLWVMRRRRRSAVTYSSVALIRAAAPSRAGWKRRLPLVLVLAALSSLGVAAARPQVQLEVPISQSAVILALDVSGSMCATDVEPNRLTAAQKAVREFVTSQDSRTRIGLVIFSGSAQLAVAPTTERDDLLTTIDTLTTGRGTTIGAAILASVDAIAQINPDIAPIDASLAPGGRVADGAPPVAPEIVVLLTDGANTRGITAADAAEVAAQRGIRVYPIGFGTTNPTSLVCTADQLGGSQFGPVPGGPGGGGGLGGNGTGGRNFLVADEPALRQVAATTGGRYFSAGDAQQLRAVLADLPRNVTVQSRDREVSVGLVAAALLLLVGAAWSATRWTPFPS